MRLSTMQDIGGLRAVLDQPNDVYKLSKAPSLFVEIQLRSHLQHIWATGVEVLGTLQQSSFKSGYGEKKWLEMFSLVSSVFALKEGTPVLKVHEKISKEKVLIKAQKLIHELQVIEQLNIYTNLYELEPLKVSRGRTGDYSLISLNSKTNSIRVESFSASKVEGAFRAYMDLEKKYLEDSSMNVVLVNSGNIKKLELSYPNYFMDTKVLLKNLSLIAIGKYL